MAERSYDPMVPVKVGTAGLPERSGHGTHWREGKQADVSGEGNIGETQNSNCYAQRTRQTNRTSQGGSEASVHKIWIEQCAATEDIRERFGLKNARTI
jgi:hypothetical protein